MAGLFDSNGNLTTSKQTKNLTLIKQFKNVKKQFNKTKRKQ